MLSAPEIERADQMSRKRAILMVVATLAFLIVQAFGRPVFVSGVNTAPHARTVLWAVNAAVLLLNLQTGGGLLTFGRFRRYINDEVSRENYRKAASWGFWVAMVVGLVLYGLPAAASMSGRESIYLVVTAAVGWACLSFGVLELQAHGGE
jgi:hypothetical protein